MFSHVEGLGFWGCLRYRTCMFSVFEGLGLRFGVASCIGSVGFCCY